MRRNFSHSLTEGVIIRGFNKAKLFFCEADKQRFIAGLFRYSALTKVGIVSYALENSQVRLEVISTDKKRISVFIRRMLTSYVQHYFNKKYHRWGSLIQSPFINFSPEGEEFNCGARSILKRDCFSGGKLREEFSSFAETVEAFKAGKAVRLATDVLRERYSLESFMKVLTCTARSELPRLAFTPRGRQVGEYLGVWGKKKNEGFSCTGKDLSDLVKKVKNLRKNHVTLSEIAKILQISLRKLKILIRE